MMKQLLSESEAVQEVETIINSVIGNRWMVAVWCVEETSQGSMLRLAGKVSWKFPVGDFSESVKLLRSCLDKELIGSEPAVPPPLEPAPFLQERQTSVETLSEALRRSERKDMQ